MRFKRAAVFCIAMLMASLFLASCGAGGEGETGATKVYIGLTAPLSGMGAAYGEDIKAGLDMAINEINSAGGVTIGDTDYIFILKAADDATIPDQALANAERFVLQEDINIIFDPLANTIGPLMDINTKEGEEFLIMSYTSVPLYLSKPNPLYVQGPPAFTVYMKPFVGMAMAKGWKKAALLQTTGAYGEMWAKAFTQAWTAAGGSVVATASANYYTETDFTPYLSKALANAPDVMLIGGPSEPTALLVEQARNLGYAGGFIVMDQAKVDYMADYLGGWGKLEGTIGVLPTELTEAPAMPAFSQRYREEYGKRVTWETAICYTMFHLLVDSMKIAGSVDDIKAIRAAFAKNAVAPPDKFPVEFVGIDDATGHLHMPAQCGIVVNGKFEANPIVYWWEE